MGSRREWSFRALSNVHFMWSLHWRFSLCFEMEVCVFSSLLTVLCVGLFGKYTYATGEYDCVCVCVFNFISLNINDLCILLELSDKKKNQQ